MTSLYIGPPISVDPETGVVTHYVECAECRGAGYVEYKSCQHSGDCPCDGHEHPCFNCGGNGTIADSDCACDACMKTYDMWLEGQAKAS